MNVEQNGNHNGGNGKDDSMAARQEVSGASPDQQGEEVLDPTVAEIRFAELRRGRDAEDMAALYVQPSAIEHLGPIRENYWLSGVDYTAADIRAYFRNSNVHAIVARNPAGRVIGTIALQTDPRQRAARAQLWVVDTRAQYAGPGVGLELLKKAEAFTFAPRAEEENEPGGLDLPHLEAGVIVGINDDWTPRPVSILRAEHFMSPEPEPVRDRGVSWEIKRGGGEWNLHRTVELYRLPRARYMMSNWRRMPIDLAQLYGRQPLLPPGRAA